MQSYIFYELIEFEKIQIVVAVEIISERQDLCDRMIREF